MVDTLELSGDSGIELLCLLSGWELLIDLCFVFGDIGVEGNDPFMLLCALLLLLVEVFKVRELVS